MSLSLNSWREGWSLTTQLINQLKRSHSPSTTANGDRPQIEHDQVTILVVFIAYLK